MQGVAYKICPSCQARSSADHRYCPACGTDLLEVDEADGDPYMGLVLADKYSVEELIGEGAMGRVYRAEQLALKKSFAAKILAPHLTHDEASHARFANEAHNAASLNHPNCVSVVDYGTQDGVTYIVMEYVQGRTLEEVINSDHPLAPERIVDLTLQVLDALAEAHGLGILHRDLKPENILVQQLRTHGELAKVLDFGIAKLMDTAEKGLQQEGLTHQGLVCGTPEYMSPEQARGQKLDARSDLYAVGVILYQMITGRPPFESHSAVELLHMHLHDDPIPPSKLLGAEPTPLEAICLRAMSKDPDARHSSAADFREALVNVTSPTTAAETILCQSCGARMSTDARFCASCGAAAPAPDARPFSRSRHPTAGSGITAAAVGEDTSEILRNFPLPLVGREDVIALASHLLAMPSELQIQSISGEPGVGKTRLIDEIATMAEETGWRVFYIGQDPSGARTPLWPVRRMVAQLLDLNPEAITTQDLGRAANLSGVAFEELPGLAEVFGLEGPAKDVEFQVRKRECHSSAVQAMLSGGRGQPLLLAFDDVQGFDTASRETLRRLARGTAETPVFVLVASNELDLDWLGAEVERIGPLSTASIMELATKLKLPDEVDGEVIEKLAASGPLSPLQVELHLRLVIDGVVCPSEASAEQLVRTRLENLELGARAVLEAAAVLGERFPEADLATMVGRLRNGPSRTELGAVLTQLHIRGLLLITAHGERAFSHRTLHETVYATIPESRRRALHTIALTESRSARESVSVRAVHALAAKSIDAAEFLEEAADAAEACFDDVSASEYLRAALRASEQMPTGGDRLAREARLAQKASRVMRTQSSAREALDLLQEQIANEHSPANEGVLYMALGQQLLRLNLYDEAVNDLKRALSPLIAAGERARILEIYSELGAVYARRGDRQRGFEELREGLDMCTLGEGPRADIDFKIWRYLLRMSDMMRANGSVRDARTWAEHALFQAERHADQLGILRCHAQMAWILRELKQVALAEQHLARALDEARYFGDRLTTAELLIERARARAARGRLGDARRCCEEALRLARVVEWTAGISHAERAISMIEKQEARARVSGAASTAK